MEEQKNNKNFWWTIALLVIVIVVLLAFLFTTRVSEERPSILLFMEFSGTLLSIVLSVFAIAYSHTSMTESNRQWSYVDKATKQIETNTNQIFNNNNNLLLLVYELSNTIHHMDGMMGSNYQRQSSIESIRKLESNNVLPQNNISGNNPDTKVRS